MASMTRLAVLMPVASPWARETVLSLARLGAEVHAVDFASDPPDSYFSQSAGFQSADISRLRQELADVHLLRTPASGAARHFLAAPGLRSLLGRIAPDVLLTLYGGGFATLAWLSGFRPYVVYVVGSDVLRIGPLRTILSRFSLRNASRVIANGRYLAQRTREMERNARVKPLYLGVDTDEFSPGVPASRPRIVCTRGFLPLYNNGYLVEGLAALNGNAPRDLEVTFASPGPELPTVQGLADKLLPDALRQRIRFCNGLARAQLVEELQRSQVYISLSRSDGTSSSLLEAMACGAFPVISDIPQNREWVTPEEDNGILVPFDQPQALADALQRSLADSGWRARAAVYNRKKVVENGASARTMPELLGILEEVRAGVV
jgi:glycosyltransferase involved in cell wall biosynthesis